ncbi:MAG TPA: FAD-dependent oxidoreductase [Longimicrobiales bacterium]|nr:FAD-dependent oxidoreductase [Longimicrobiales bacterium]
MAESSTELTGPDLRLGVPASALTDGEPVLGHVDGEAVLLTLLDGVPYAIGAHCTHYGGPLADGVVDGGTVRCPWHHACFDLRTGEALRPPALNDLPRWNAELRDGVVVVTGRIEPPSTLGPVDRQPRVAGRAPESVVIVGAGAAGAVAAETLRREGYDGSITMVDPDPDATVDRPNLSKDYLAGNAPEEWIPLRSPDFYEAHDIDRILGRSAVAIDTAGRRVELDDGTILTYGALLIATGAEPIRLPDAVTGGRVVHYLRTLADSRAIIAAAAGASRAVVLGASFIGLEVAASLRARGLEVHVVAPESVPLARILGVPLGSFVRRVHEQNGVVFHLERTAASMDARSVTLDDGTRLDADIVVAGIGVRPRTALAEHAGLDIDNGIAVDAQLRTSAPGIWAAGDVASWPDPRSGERIRVEHWVLAQRMGQAAALSMLGALDRFDAVPFFWSAHYDVVIDVVGHARGWESVEMTGSLEARDVTATFLGDGLTLAVATIGRNHDSLAAELDLEQGA